MYETRDLVLVLMTRLPRRRPALKSSTAASIAARLHVARFSTYTRAASGDLELAIALYRWNLQLAGALFEVLTATEVVLRNALDAQLRPWNARQIDRATGRHHSADWTSDPGRPLNGLTSGARKRAYDNALTARGGRPAGHPRKTAPITHDDVIAQLTFGVFVKLLPTSDVSSSTYQARQILWHQSLVSAFPHANDPDGRATAGRAERLLALRNRVAHGEPLLEVNPVHRVRDAGRLLASIDPEVAGWVMGPSRVSAVVGARPR